MDGDLRTEGRGLTPFDLDSSLSDRRKNVAGRRCVVG
jgi:hypothetical protein